MEALATTNIQAEETPRAMQPGNQAELGAVVQRLMEPVMGAMSKLLEQNMKALQELAQAQKMQSDRMEAIERQLRLNTPVSPTQEKYLKGEIQRRAKELLSKKGLEEDRKAATALGSCIKKAVLARYGAAQLREIPKSEYTVAMSQIGSWNDQIELLKITKAARKRAESLRDYADETRTSGLLEE